MSLHEAVREFVVARIESGAERRLTAPGLTDAFMRDRVDLGAWVAVPDDQLAAQYIGLTQVVREKLRLIVPDRPEPRDEPDQMPLIPENKLLNEYYSVKGEGDDEHYVRRSDLSEDEMRQITKRFRALSVHYNRHAKALEADWHRTHQPELVEQ